MDYVDFEFYFGEILVVIGDNGVGKLIFIKVLSGVVQFDEGDVLFDGQLVNFILLIDVREVGIEIVY